VGATVTSLLVTTDVDTSGVAILAVAGPLVADAGDSLAAVVCATLRQREPTRLVVDLARVGVADEAAIQVLLRCRAAALRAGVTFRVIRPQGPVRRVLHRHGACHLLTWDPAPDRPPRLASAGGGRRSRP
jgi:anti-anti-sigma regulatory factor